MSVDTFLALAEQGGFLDAKTAAKLRAKMAGQGHAVSMKDLSALLVKKGMLTPFQAEKLISATQAAGTKELGLASDSSADSDSTFRLGPGKHSDTKKSLELLDDMDADRMTLLQAKPSDANAGDRMDDLPGLTENRSILGNLEYLDGDDDFNVPVVHTGGNIWQIIKRAIRQRAPKRGQRWDSSLMLGGGGLLLSLILIGTFLYFVLASGSGDEMFQMADDDYKSQLYAQALQKYDRFVESYPKHQKVSLARTRMGLARIRTEVATRNWSKSMSAVQRELPSLRSESSFDSARSELAGILPDIYDGFVAQANGAQDTDVKERFLDKADEILSLIQNPDNLPSSLRRQIQSRVDATGDQSQQLRREIARRRDIVKSIGEINQAIATGDSVSAYALRDKLLDRQPGAGKDDELKAATMEISGVERQSIRVVNQKVNATTSPRPAPDLRAIPLVMRRGGQAEKLSGRFLAINARGAVYGLDGETGQVLWRRWVGFESNLPPVAISQSADSDWLVIDHRYGDLMRLDAKSGKLVWRIEVGAPAAGPTIDGNRVLQATANGTLLSIDIQDGSISQKVSFPQELSSPVAVDHEHGWVFQAAHHSTIYVLKADTMECTHTLYTGHLAGMVTVAPVIARDLVLVVENSATDYCLLHVFARGQQGALVAASDPIRLQGIVAESPVTYGRTVIVTTDRGAVYVMEAAADNPSEPVRIFAQIHPRSDRTASHFALLSDNRIFIAGWGLAEFEVLAARGSLERRWAEQVDDSHLTAPTLFADTLVSARWSPLTCDVIIEATRIPQRGERMPATIWQSHVAAQPSGPPIAIADRAVMLTGRNGAVWRIDSQSVQNQVLESLDNDAPPMSTVLVTETGGHIFASGDERPLWMFQDRNETRTRLVTLDESARCRVEAQPQLFADGMLLCTRRGPIYLVDPASGKQLAAPFAWPSSFASDAHWRTPAASGADFAIVVNSQGIVHRLVLSAIDKRLTSTHSIDLKLRPLGAPLITGRSAYVLVRGRTEDSLLVLSTDTLETASTIALEQRALEPLLVVDDSVVVQTQDKWHVFRGVEEVWDAKLPHGPLAGSPIATDEGWLCTSLDGHITWIDSNTGEVCADLTHAADVDLGQALGASATQWRTAILAAGHDSTLHVVPLSSVATENAEGTPP